MISVKLGEPQFEGQTKTKLGNTIARTFMVKAVMTDQLTDWFGSHPNEAKAIVLKGQAAAMAREAFPKARDATRRKSPLVTGGMPASCATAPPATPPSPRSSSSRATPPALPPCRAATRAPRRSSPSAARS